MQTYRILNIRTKQFAVFESDFSAEDPDLEVNNSCSYGIDVEPGNFHCVITITYSQNGKPVLKIETEAVFQLGKESMSSFLKGKSFEMPVSTVRYFTDMLYGATRGILVCKLEGTKLVNIILPPVNWTEVIDRPLTIPLDPHD